MGPIILTSKLFGFGGIERFGRQITKAVSDHASEKSQQVTVFTLMDKANEIQANDFDEIVNLNCFGGNRFLFIVKSAFQILFYPTVVFTFHLHIAPIAYLVKLLRPKLNMGFIYMGLKHGSLYPVYGKRPSKKRISLLPQVNLRLIKRQR